MNAPPAAPPAAPPTAPPAALRRWVGASLQRKIALASGALLTLVSVVFLFLVSGFYQQRLIDQHARGSLQVNRLLQASLENAMLKRDIPGLQRILRDLGAQPGINAAMILNPDLKVRFSADPARLNESFADPLAARALRARTPQAQYMRDASGREVLRSVNPVRNRTQCGMCHGPVAQRPVNGLLVIDYDAGLIQAEARSSTLKLAAIGGGVILLLGAGLWLALWRVVIAPLERLTQAAGALRAGRLDTRVAVIGDDEIAQLGRGFNRMAADLQASLARLRQSEDFLQGVIDAIPDGIRVIDGDYRVLKANAGYCRMVGQSMEQVLAAPCHRSSHRRDAPCPHTLICCPLAELHRPGASAQLTCRDTFVGADGKDLFTEISAARVDLALDGEIRSCVIESIRDLDMQAQYSQQQRLSEIGLLAAGVAHEIFNPLSSIDLGLNALHSELDERLGEKEARYMEMIRAEVQNCIKITDSLLMLCAPPGTPESLVTLSVAAAEVLALLAYEAQSRDVRFETDIAPDLRVLAADSDIRMLVANLSLNAIHAMPEGGVLRVRARRIPPGAGAPGDATSAIELEFADQGVGIAPADIDNIFMPFWSRRADSTAGRGLGLSIVKSMLERIGATISVRSAPGEGSRFVIRFADADADADAARNDNAARHVRETRP